MLTLSPLFSTIGWTLPFEDPLSHSEKYFYKRTTEASELFHYQLSSSHPLVEVETSPPSPVISSDLTMVKKLNHNASERDRRKKINALYSSLRSLLPLNDQMKLSIPATISRVLKYIPELQHQVGGLTKKKEEILSKISRQGDAVITKENRRKIAHHNSGFVVSTSRLSENEAAIQISSHSADKIPLSAILLCLENDGLVLLNVSSFETFGGRVFYNLHFQVEKFQRLEFEIITERLLSIIETKEGNFLVK